MQFASSAQMKILRKIIHCKSLEISQENFYEGVSFSTVESLQYSDCNFAIKRTHYRFLFENLPKTSCLKKLFLRKKSMVNQRLNKV